MAAVQEVFPFFTLKSKVAKPYDEGPAESEARSVHTPPYVGN